MFAYVVVGQHEKNTKVKDTPSAIDSAMVFVITSCK
jgi:hypothetical protein